MYHRHTKCRACQGTEFTDALDLGVQPLANDFRHPGEECAGMAPLKVILCNRCGLAQLSVTVRPEILYSRYSYVTSKSETMNEHFKTIISDIAMKIKGVPLMHVGRIKIKVLEIGSNDGTFLSQFNGDVTTEVMGFEPANNLADIAHEKGVRTINRLFDEPNAVELGATGYRADVIVARHVFCHVDDWQGFIHALEFVSHKDTLVFIEVPYVVDMFKNNSFDQVYHEHLSYMNLLAMQHLLAETKFKPHKVIHYEIHGGSVGIMLRRREWEGEADASVDLTIAAEDIGYLKYKWECLGKAMQKNCGDLMKLLASLRVAGKTVCGFGASAKATVWLNAMRASKRDIAFVCDSTAQKKKCLVPGTDIPVVPESELAKADYAILTAWNFQVEIREKHRDFKGRWVLPCPEVKVL